MTECPNQPDLQELKEAVASLVVEIKAMIKSLDMNMKYMLICLCIIALGRTAVDLGERLFLRSPSSAVAEVQP